MKSLVIVAHPDDETIWMGGTILQNSDWDWTIVSLCRKNDKDRMRKFINVCKHYRANPVISDMDDEKLNQLSTKKVVAKIKEVLPGRDYDYIYTHGENGEYGHIRHREVHRAVKEMFEGDEIKCKKIFYFSYIAGKDCVPGNPELHVTVPANDPDLIVRLNRDKFIKKRFLLKEIYGFGENSFEVLSCNMAEAFKVNKK